MHLSIGKLRIRFGLIDYLLCAAAAEWDTSLINRRSFLTELTPVKFDSL